MSLLNKIILNDAILHVVNVKQFAVSGSFIFFLVLTDDNNVCIQAALERGERLGELAERTEAMRNEAETYSSAARDLMQKYKDKKWYQF